jgi:hypothetical protein
MGATPKNCKTTGKDEGPPPLNLMECGHFQLTISDNETAALLGLSDNVLELNDHSLITSLYARTSRE